MVTANMLSGTSTFRWLSKVWIVEMTQAEDKWFVDKIQQGRDTKATVLDKTNMNQSNWGLLYRTWFVTWFHSVMCDQWKRCRYERDLRHNHFLSNSWII